MHDHKRGDDLFHTANTGRMGRTGAYDNSPNHHRTNYHSNHNNDRTNLDFPNHNDDSTNHHRTHNNSPNHHLDFPNHNDDSTNHHRTHNNSPNHHLDFPNHNDDSTNHHRTHNNSPNHHLDFPNHNDDRTNHHNANHNNANHNNDRTNHNNANHHLDDSSAELSRVRRGDDLYQTANTGRMGTVVHHLDNEASQFQFQFQFQVDAASPVGNLRSGSAVRLSRFTPLDNHGTESELLELPATRRHPVSFRRSDEMEQARPIPAETRKQLAKIADEVASHPEIRPHDRFARLAVTEAVEGGLEGNAAIGALIVNPDGRVILQERNRMFVPRFRSDFHAEMVLLTRYENQHGNRSDLRGHTLVSSLEPCEMCMIRIINSGVTHTLYVASDLGKGGVTGPNALAPHWARLAEPQSFAAADCSPRLAELGLEVFKATIGGVVEKMMARRLPE